VLQANPSTYPQAYDALAYAQVGQGQLAEAIKNLSTAPEGQQLRTVLSRPLGLADIALYEGRFGDAAQFLQEGAAADMKADRPDSAAADFAFSRIYTAIAKNSTLSR